MSLSDDSPETIHPTQTGCGPNGIALEFEHSGVIVSPFELDVHKEEGRLDHARAKLSIEAGELINEKVEEREPVSIWSGTTRFSRLFYPDEGLELGTQDSYLKLFDELQIAQYVDINKSFSGNWSLGNVIEYIFDEIKNEDPYNILIDWKGTHEEVESEEVFTVQGPSGPLDVVQQVDELGQNVGLGESQIVRIGNALESAARNRYNFLQDDVDFDFEDQTALSVLHEIAQEFRFDIFTKDDGNLWIGSQEDNIRIFTASFPRSTYNLINYSVPAGNNKTKTVVVKGKQVNDGLIDMAWNLITGENNTRLCGIAMRSDLDDGNVAWVDADSADSDSIQQVAENYLKEIVSTTQSGNAEIDFLSTDFENVRQPDIRQANIDDVLIVPPHDGMCQRIVPGEYFIDRVHHQINPNSGWIINLGIKRIITSEIDTGTFVYDTGDNEVVEEMNTTAFYWGDQTLAGISGRGFNSVGDGIIDSDMTEEIED